MRRKIITCDHCGKELDEMHDYVDNEVEILNWFETDLCKKCAKELDSYAFVFCGKVVLKEDIDQSEVEQKEEADQ